FEVSPGPDGGLWALLHKSGERRPSLLRKDRMLERPVAEAPPSGEAPPLATQTLGNAQRYRPFAWENVELGPMLAFAAAGAGGFVGQFLARRRTSSAPTG